MKWDTLSTDEKNLLIHEKVLGLPIPGKVPERVLRGLLSMGLPIEHQGTRTALDEYDPIQHIPNYVGDSGRGAEVLKFVTDKEHLRDEFLLKLLGNHNEEIRGDIDANDRICHAAALVMGLVDE